MEQSQIHRITKRQSVGEKREDRREKREERREKREERREKREERTGNREEGRGKREEGRGKREEGRGKREGRGDKRETREERREVSEEPREKREERREESFWKLSQLTLACGRSSRRRRSVCSVAEDEAKHEGEHVFSHRFSDDDDETGVAFFAGISIRDVRHERALEVVNLPCVWHMVLTFL